MAENESGKPKPDITLSNGREVIVDLSKISVREWREYVRSDAGPEDDDAMLSRLTGMKPEEIADLSYLDWRRLDKAFTDKIRNPLETTG